MSRRCKYSIKQLANGLVHSPGAVYWVSVATRHGFVALPAYLKTLLRREEGLPRLLTKVQQAPCVTLQVKRWHHLTAAISASIPDCQASIRKEMLPPRATVSLSCLLNRRSGETGWTQVQHGHRLTFAAFSLEHIQAYTILYTCLETYNLDNPCNSGKTCKTKAVKMTKGSFTFLGTNTTLSLVYVVESVDCMDSGRLNSRQNI